MVVHIDAAVVTIDDRSLRLLLLKLRNPAGGHLLSLPSTVVNHDDQLDRAAQQLVGDGTSPDYAVRQVGTFSVVAPVAGDRVVTIGYVVPAPLRRLRPQLDQDCLLVELRDGVALDGAGRQHLLATDQAAIVAAAVTNLRLDLETSSFAFGLLGEEFTLRELQHAHEAIRGVALNKPAFRKRMLDGGKLVATGRRESDQRFRPAEYYRLREEAA